MNALCRVSMLALLAPVAMAQQVWKVNCAGAHGAHFTDLPAAVAAAAPGDTILVYITVPSACSVYTAPVINKPLSIIGTMIGEPPGNNTPTKAQIHGALAISGIAQGQQLLLSNLVVFHAVLPPPWATGVSSPITVTDCDGSVVFEDVYYSSVGPGPVVRFERCDHVVLRGSQFHIGGAPVQFIDTTALISTTIIDYKSPISISPFAFNTEALNLLRSHVTIVGSRVEGASPASPNYGVTPGAIVNNSTLRIGASADLYGGLNAGHPPPYFPNDYYVAYLVTGSLPSVIEKDPRATAYQYPAQVPTITPIDETLHDWIVADEWYRVLTNGPPGGTALLFVGNMLFPTVTPLGGLGVDPASALLLDIAALPGPWGTHQWTFFCPPWVPSGHAFAFQSLTVSPTGVLGLTQPSPFTVAWDKDRLP